MLIKQYHHHHRRPLDPSCHWSPLAGVMVLSEDGVMVLSEESSANFPR